MRPLLLVGFGSLVGRLKELPRLRYRGVFKVAMAERRVHRDREGAVYGYSAIVEARPVVRL